MDDIDKSNLNETEIPSENEESISIETKENTKKSKKISKDKIKKRKAIWYSIRITLLALVLGALFAFISDITDEKTTLIGSIILLLALVLISIFFDGVGIAVTSCDLAPLTSMASRKEYAAKTAIKLVKNSSKVSSICSDLIGDTFGIVSGSCAAVLAIRLIGIYSNDSETFKMWISVAITAVVTALTIGGKSFLKHVAIEKSKEFTLFIAKIIAIFSKSERAILKKNRKKKDEEVTEWD